MKSLRAVRRCLRAGLSAGLLYLSAGSVCADLPVHENFSYPGGAVKDREGGTGFLTAWSAVGGARHSNQGLTFPGYSSFGGAAITAGGNVPVYRDLSRRNGSNDGTNTLYLSCLARLCPENTTPFGPNSGAYAGLSLFDGDSERLFVGMPFNRSHWGIERTGHTVATSDTPINETTRLIVLRIDFTPLDADIIMYVDPPVGGAEPMVADASITDYPTFSFDRIRIQSGVPTDGPQVYLDEFHLGRSYASVTSNMPLFHVYDGFQAPIHSDWVAYRSGGYGFKSDWYGPPVVTEPGLQYQNLRQAGNKLTIEGNNYPVVRVLDTGLWPDPGSPGTVYGSFLTRINPDNEQFFGPGSGASATVMFVENMATKLRAGLCQDEDTYGIEAGGKKACSSVLADTDTTLLVTRIDYTGTGTVNVRLYVNPTPGSSEPAAANAELLDIPEFRADSIHIVSNGFNGGPKCDFDEIRIGHSFEEACPPGVTISGTIDFEDLNPAAPPQLVTFEFRPTGGGESFFQTDRIGPDGVFNQRGVSAADYAMWVKANRFLAKTVPVDASDADGDNANGDVSGVTVTLIPGDANNDNSIDVFDLAKLIETFDALADTLLYDPNADFNHDGSIDVFDLDILIRNFDKVGDT